MPTCDCCKAEVKEVDGLGECEECARENEQMARAMDYGDCPELMYADFEARIKCGECEQVKTVGGFIWYHRLSSSRTDEQGNYLGWNCDRCADRIEAGMGY